MFETEIDTEDNNSCFTEHERNQNVQLSVISAAVSLLSILACVVVIGLIILLKKYMFFIQRLILYLSIAAFLNCLALTLRLIRLADNEGNFEDPILHTLCIISGFLDQTTAWFLTLAFVCITFTLFRSAVFHKDSERFEFYYILIIFISPFLITWIPFVRNNYGQAGAWCWIQDNTIDENCTVEKDKLGIALRYALWYIPNYFILGFILLTYIYIIINVSRQRRKWYGRYDPEARQRKEMMRKEVWPLLFYPLGFIIMSLFPLINRLHNTFSDDTPYALWLLHAIFEPLEGGYIALVYTFDRETLRRLNFFRIMASIRSRTRIREYPVTRGYTDSFSEPNEPRCYGFKDETAVIYNDKVDYGSTQVDSKT